MAIRFGNNSGGGNANGFIENQEAAPQNAAFWIDGNGHAEVFLADSGVQVGNIPLGSQVVIDRESIVMNKVTPTNSSFTVEEDGISFDADDVAFSINLHPGGNPTLVTGNVPVVFNAVNVQRDTAATLPNDLVRLVDVTSLNGFIKNQILTRQSAVFSIDGNGIVNSLFAINSGNTLTGQLSPGRLTFTSTIDTFETHVERGYIRLTGPVGILEVSATGATFTIEAITGGPILFVTQVQASLAPVDPNDLVRLQDINALAGYIQNNPITDPPQTADFNISGFGAASQLVATTRMTVSPLSGTGPTSFMDLGFMRVSLNSGSNPVCNVTYESLFFHSTAGDIFGIDTANGTTIVISSPIARPIIFSSRVQSSVTPTVTNDLVRLQDLTGALLSGFVTGALPFGNSTGGLDVGSTQLYWDNTNTRFGIGTAGAPVVKLHVITGAGAQFRIGFNTTNYLNFQVSGTGVTTITPAGSGTPTVLIAGKLQCSSTPTGTNDVLRLQDMPSGNVSQALTAQTTVVVTIGVTMANTMYKVAYAATNAAAAVNFFITSKSTTQFTVTYLAPITATVTFDWMVSL